MSHTEFLTPEPSEEQLSIAIIVPRYRGQWVFVRNRSRTGWEFPGGHREYGETIVQTARRELWEETGIEDAVLEQVCCVRMGHSIGALFFAEVNATGQIPKGSEIAELLFSAIPPAETAYDNLPLFYERVQWWLNLRAGAGELWDIYDENRNLTGKLHRRGEPLKPGEKHLVVHVWVRDPQGRYLLTKRSPNKGFPNMWEPTGGSALAGETSIQAALREVREETGLLLLPENGRIAEQRCWTDHFTDIWLFLQDFSADTLTLQEAETCDARKADIEEILTLKKDGLLVPIDDLHPLLEKLERMH